LNNSGNYDAQKSVGPVDNVNTKESHVWSIYIRFMYLLLNLTRYAPTLRPRACSW